MQHFSVDDFHAIIADYTPNSVTAEVWSETADFTRQAVTDLDLRPDTASRDKLRTTLGVVARLAAWVYVQYGAVTRETVFHHNIIMDYFESNAAKHLTKRAAGAQRSLLFRIGAELNPEWSREVTWGMTYEPALEPYSDSDIERFFAWARSQPTKKREAGCILLLALTLGAGLRAGEVARLRGHDIVIDQQGVIVRPHGYRGAAHRNVPVHVAFQQYVIDAYNELPSADDYLFRPGRSSEETTLVSSYIRRVTRESDKHYPDTRRLRNTWIVRMITSGVPTDVICGAAGLNNLNQFDRWVVEAGRARESQYRLMLQGGSPGHGPGLRAVQ